MLIYTDTKYRPKRKSRKQAVARRPPLPREGIKDPLRTAPYRRQGTEGIQSLDTRPTSGTAVDRPQYTGDRLLGISIVHKSCLQPVFSQDEAKDFSSMRR